jgi:hypothetical protein
MITGLDCGHLLPAEKSECWLMRGDGTTECYDCRTKADRAYLANPDNQQFTGQLSPDEDWILNGVGGRIAEVIGRTRPFPGLVRLLRVRSFDGREWRWTGPRYSTIMTFYLDKERRGL